MAWFPDSFAEADAHLAGAWTRAGVRTAERIHPAPGFGEGLKTRAAYFGEEGSPRLLVVLAGTHGVEGHLGSAVQLALTEALTAGSGGGTGLLLVHALNPYGYAVGRRVDHENIDTNRNFIDFSLRLPANPAYAEAHDILFSDTARAGGPRLELVMEWAGRVGMDHAQQAISGGQYVREDGLFFGGRRAGWSRQAYCELVAELAGDPDEVLVLDIHTGLGQSGACQRIFGGGDRGFASALLDDLLDPSGSASAELAGTVAGYAPAFPSARRFAGAVLEFGTAPLLQVFAGLWGEQLATLSGDDARISAARDQLRQLFAPPDPGWRDGTAALCRSIVAESHARLAART